MRVITCHTSPLTGAVSRRPFPLCLREVFRRLVRYRKSVRFSEIFDLAPTTTATGRRRRRGVAPPATVGAGRLGALSLTPHYGKCVLRLARCWNLVPQVCHFGHEVCGSSQSFCSVAMCDLHIALTTACTRFPAPARPRVRCAPPRALGAFRRLKALEAVNPPQKNPL